MKRRTFQVISPLDQSVYLEREYADSGEIESKLVSSENAQKSWKNTSISQRAEICQKAVDFLVSHADEIGQEISRQMGRPIAYTPNEIKGGLKERSEYMINIAASSLANIDIDHKRYIKKEPLGTVLVLAPWNYPFLTSVNAIIPAILAGNSVILKASEQTPLTAERYAQAFDHASLPEGVFHYLHMDHDQVAKVIRDERVHYVAFTGSVEGGEAVESAMAGRFIGSGLELGGKDAAYVREDADLENAVANLVDGSFFNSGQSCCGIERIYVHENVYDSFLEEFVALTKKYKMGDALHPKTQIGPMARSRSAMKVHEAIEMAVKEGASRCIRHLEENRQAYLFPEVLTNVNHDMEIMQKETFGPVVGIMKVKDDDEAIVLMNDSKYGLTASVWTSDVDVATTIGDQLKVGTVFMNRCDYLDPALAWTGVKHSGRGCTLSSIGYDSFTRPKSFHIRTL